MKKLNNGVRSMTKCPDVLSASSLVTFILLALCWLTPQTSAAQAAFPIQWATGRMTVPNSVAYSPDSTLMAVGDGGGVQIITVATGAITYLPTAATYGVASVSFAANGKTLAACGLNALGGVAEVWDVASHTQLRTLPTAANSVANSVALSPDGSVLVIGGQGYDPITTSGFGVLEIWNTSSGALISSLKTASSNGVESVKISPDGKSLAAGGLSNTTGILELWNLSTDQLTATLNTAAKFGVSSVAFSPDGKTLAAGGFGSPNNVDSGILETWSVANLTRIRTFQTVADAKIGAVCFSPDGKTLVDGGGRNMMGLLELWSVSTGTLTTVFDTAAKPVATVAFSPDGSTIAVGGQTDIGGVLETWSATSWDLLNTISTPKSYLVTAVAISPDGATIVDGGSIIDGYGTVGFLEFWDVATATRIRQIIFATNIRTISFSPDGKTLAVGGFRGASSGPSSFLQIWNASNGGVINTLDPGATQIVASVAFSPDGKTLAVGGKSAVGVLELWDIGTSTRKSTLNTSATGCVYSVAYAPDGKSLVSGGYDASGGILETWNTSTESSTYALKTSARTIQSVAFSPDSTMIASGGFNAKSYGVLELWGTSTGKLVSSIPMDLFAGMANPVTFSQSGAVLFAASDVGLQTFTTTNSKELDAFKIGFLRTLTLSATRNLMAFSMDNGVLVVAQRPAYNLVTLSSILLNPTSLLGGLTSTATITLSNPAPTGGVEVSLTSSSLRAVVPATVTVPAGTTSVPFTITTSGVNVQTAAVITAGTAQGSISSTLTIKSAALASLNLVPTKVVGGNVATGVVTLSGMAGQGGTVVGISLSNQLITAPSTVTVAEGQTVGRFGINTPGVSSEQTIAVTALLGNVSQSATLTVSPATISEVTLDPASLAGGGMSTGAVILTGAAKPGGVVVALTGSLTGVTLPKTLPIAAGLTRGSFTIKTTPVSAQKVATISANLGTNAKSASLTVTPPPLVSLTLNPVTVAGGTSAGAIVTLGGPAATGGVTVKLSSSSTAAVPPPTVIVLAGKTQANFSVKTVSATTQKVATLTASLNGVGKTATLTVTPPMLTSITVSPANVVGGTSTKGTVTLNGPAGTGGAKISLASNSASATLPATVTVPANQSTVTFVIKTLAVSTQTLATLSATFGGVTKTAGLAITAPKLVSLTMSPNSVKGGATSKGTVTISSVAPAGGLVIMLSSNQGSATSPTSVTIPAGTKSATFSVKTTAVGTKTNAMITATLGAASLQATLIIT